MAGSRLEKIGTVFSRVQNLLRSGALKKSAKPVWYDVYEAFPPKREPVYVKPLPKRYGKVVDVVPEIFYKEDEIRAKFYEVYGTGYRAFDLSNANFVSTCQRFVEKYTELERSGQWEKEALFEETGKALLSEGLVLRRTGEPTVAAETKNILLGMKLADMLAELQGEMAEKMENPEEAAPTPQ